MRVYLQNGLAAISYYPQGYGAFIARHRMPALVGTNISVGTNIMQRNFMPFFAICAVLGCIIFAASILVADFVVPDHDWMADTISDLGAGKYEYIVDIGIYAFAGAIMCAALSAAHMRIEKRTWIGAIFSLTTLAFIVFLVGAKNEYGDSDTDGTVIHIYLVYALGLLVALVPILMAPGTKIIDKKYALALYVFSAIWVISAPIFFLVPTGYDGIYERYLGLLVFGLIGILVRMFLHYNAVFRVRGPHLFDARQPSSLSA